MWESIFRSIFRRMLTYTQSKRCRSSQPHQNSNTKHFERIICKHTVDRHRHRLKATHTHVHIDEPTATRSFLIHLKPKKIYWIYVRPITKCNLIFDLKCGIEIRHKALVVVCLSIVCVCVPHSRAMSNKFRSFFHSLCAIRIVYRIETIDLDVLLLV